MSYECRNSYIQQPLSLYSNTHTPLFVGDPQLSVMESVLFHELLQVVRVSQQLYTATFIALL